MAPAPIYPRPVSPLCAEPYHFHPQDVPYASSSHSSGGEVRAAKRRRIEKLGEQYLRGDGLHILSAGLKGPFGNSWNNPWAKRKTSVRSAVVEIPETAGKPVKQREAQKVGPAIAKSGKVEEWLRRNSAYSGLEIVEQTSPTPPHVKVVNCDDALLTKQEGQLKRHELQGALKGQDSRLEKRKLEGGHTESHSAQLSPRQPSYAAGTEPHGKISDPAHIERRAWVSHATNADRAEFAALKSKRRALEVAPSSTMLSPFEYRRVSEENQKPRKIQEIAGRCAGETKLAIPPAKNNSTESILKTDRQSREKSEPLVLDTARDQPVQVVTTGISAAAPVLSAESSNLPSAQPHSLALPPPSTNDLTIDEVALEQPMEPTFPIEPQKERMRSKDDEVPHTKQADNGATPLAVGKSMTAQAIKGVNVDSSQTPLPTNVAREDLSLNTQDMLAGMSPSPMAFSTIKKATSKIHHRSTPVTATKSRPEKPSSHMLAPQEERVSSGSSQGSLKTSLRVSKGQVVAAGKENKSIKFGEEETNDGSVGVLTSSAKQSLIASSPKRLKSALKPSGPPPSTARFPSTKGSISTGIDGGQNAPVVEDDAFDLDGAIDDLGSYLGTWDVEKEASSLAIDM